MNKFLINLVGHTDQYLAKKQMIKEIFAYTKFQHRCFSCHELFAGVFNLNKCLIEVYSFFINPNFAISKTFKAEEIHERTFVFV